MLLHGRAEGWMDGGIWQKEEKNKAKKGGCLTKNERLVGEV